MDNLYKCIIEKAIQMLKPKRIWVFGSRARGDFQPRSDIDLAFEFDEQSSIEHWAQYCIELDDEAPTLLKMDLVNLNEANTELKKNILEQGKVIYQK